VHDRVQKTRLAVLEVGVLFADPFAIPASSVLAYGK